MRSIEIKFDNGVPNSVDVIIESNGVTVEFSDEKKEKAVVKDIDKSDNKAEPKVDNTTSNINTQQIIENAIKTAVEKAVERTVEAKKSNDTTPNTTGTTSTPSKVYNPVASQVIFKRTRDFDESMNDAKKREKEAEEKIEARNRQAEKDAIRRKLNLPTKNSNYGSVRVDWDVAKIEQFIRDYENMPLYEVTKKYNFETERSCMMTKVDLQSKLRLAKTM